MGFILYTQNTTKNAVPLGTAFLVVFFICKEWTPSRMIASIISVPKINTKITTKNEPRGTERITSVIICNLQTAYSATDKIWVIGNCLPSQFASFCSAAFEEGTCARHWDDYLCWPVSGVGSTVRIPCRASLPFVQAVMEAMPDFERDEIEGEWARESHPYWHPHLQSERTLHVSTWYWWIDP